MRKGIGKDPEPSFFFQSSNSPARSGGTPRSFEEDQKRLRASGRIEMYYVLLTCHTPYRLTYFFGPQLRCDSCTAPPAKRSPEGSLYSSRSFLM